MDKEKFFENPKNFLENKALEILYDEKSNNTEKLEALKILCRCAVL